MKSQAPLSKGPGSIRRNMEMLMLKPQSKVRQRAIATIAKKNNIQPKAAQWKQAMAISRGLARRK